MNQNNKLFDDICKEILHTVEGGPYRIISLEDLSYEDVRNFVEHHPDADYDYPACDVDCEWPISARFRAAEAPDNISTITVQKAGSLSIDIENLIQLDRQIIYISVDRVSRHYGGPQEGGWWYDAGDVEDYESVVIYFTNQRPYIDAENSEKIKRTVDRWESQYSFDTDYQSSMSPRGYDYRWRICESIPKSWSNYRPYC